MIEHECTDVKICECDLSAYEPREECPVHGNPYYYQPRCIICGKYMKRNV